MRLLSTCAAALMALAPAAPAAETFRNPINRSADPWVGFAGGQYRLTATQGDRVRLWSAPSLRDLPDAKPLTVWERGNGVWAAEFHHLPVDGKRRWFCYFTKTDGPDNGHRMFVMESTTDSIEGPYGQAVQLRTDPKDEFYAIDGTVFEQAGKLYFAWAGHPGHRLFLSEMKDPRTLAGERVLIPASGFGCEEVREGPYVIHHGGRVFLTYSACDTQKPDYKVGYLWAAADADPLKVDSWIQHPEPLLARADDHDVYGPGHHSFFKSPDGTEDWIAYHGKTSASYTYKGRTTRAQKLEWDSDGFPKKIVPLPLDAEIPLPSGDPG